MFPLASVLLTTAEEPFELRKCKFATKMSHFWVQIPVASHTIDNGSHFPGDNAVVYSSPSSPKSKNYAALRPHVSRA